MPVLLAVLLGALCLLPAQIAGASTDARTGVNGGAGAHANHVATATFLRAQLHFVESFRDNLPAAQRAAAALVAKLSGECPQVLAGAPRLAPAGAPSKAAVTELKQQGEIEAEAYTALLRSWLSVDADGAQTFLAGTRGVRWSDAQLTGAVRAEAAAAARDFLGTPPAVCVDLRAWVASGYSKLTAATTALAKELELDGESEASAIDRQLEPYETAADRRLARKIARASHAVNEGDHGLSGLVAQLLSTIGLPLDANSDRTAIGGGRTAAGASFTVSIENRGGGGGEHPCTLSVDVEEGTGVGGGGRCVEAADVGVPEIRCSAGLLPIALLTPASVHSVSLLLSDGRQIVSPVLAFPASVGLPYGYYYQAIRGPSPIAISLTELDAEGKPLAVVKLRRLVECTSKPVKLIAGGVIGHGNVPDGVRYQVTVGRYRYLGEVQDKINVEFAGGGSGGTEVNGFPRHHVALMSESECARRRTTVFVAVLPSAQDTMLARTAAGFATFHQVALAPALDRGGGAAYQAFTTLPRELIVRDPRGHTIFAERFNPRQRSQVCPDGASGTVTGFGVGDGG